MADGISRGLARLEGESDEEFKERRAREVAYRLEREARIEALGNAVVPQVVMAYPYRRVMELELELHSSSAGA